MADYQARIDFLVSGQQQLRQLEQRLEGIEQNITGIQSRWRRATAAFQRSQAVLGATGRDAPRGAGGRFASDPSRAQRLAALALERRAQIEQRLSRLAAARARTDARNAAGRIAGQQRVNRQIERQITLESKLNSATELYNTNLRKFQRGGSGAGSGALQERAQQIQAAFQAFESGGSRNLRLVRALATELGRVVEAQNELNRAQSLSSKGFEAGRRLQERLDAVSATGNIPGERVRGARSLATQAIAAANAGDQVRYANAIRRATAATARLERESNGVSQALREQERETRRSARNASARRQRRVGAASSALIGAGFPLLFGQGAGAAVGGGVGGLAGGLIGGPAGFALSIVGTVFGNSVDQFVSGAQKAGQSLNSTGQTLEFMREKSIFSSDAIKEQVAVLEEQGKVQEIATLLTKDLVSAIGNKGVQSLQDLGKTTNETTRLWNTLTLQLQALIAGPLNAFLKLVNSLLKGATTKQRFNALAADMKGNAEFEAAVKARRGGGRTGVVSQANMEELISMFESKRPITASVPVTGADLRSITAPKAEGEGALKGSQRRTAAIKASAQALFMSAMLQDRINAAERIGAKEQALALAHRRDQVKLTGEYNARIAKVADTENKAQEIAALRQERNAKLVAQQLDYENKSLALQMQRQAAGVQVSSQLQNEVYLLEETLAGRGREAAIQQEISDKIVATGALNDFERAKDIADQVRRKAALQEQLVEARKLEAVYADIASTLSQGMTQALKDVVKGTQSLRDAAMSMLNNVLNKIIDIAMNMAMFGVASGTGTGGGLLGGLFGLGKTAVPGRAGGGPVKGKMPYIVGENGPELYVPGRSGTIVPNHKLPKMVDLGGKFMPFHPLFFSAMFGLGNFGNNRQAVMESFGARFSQYAGGTMPFGALQGRAAGGPVTGGTPYIVGEQGPEMFVPRSGGGMGGNVSNNIVVNVSASGGNVEGDQQGAKQLGQAVAAAVQQELIRQKRPGGLLA